MQGTINANKNCTLVCEVIVSIVTRIVHFIVSVVIVSMFEVNFLTS